MRFEVPVYGKSVRANCFEIIVFGVVSRKLMLCGRCKHICTWFEFQFADCFLEHCGVDFHLFAIGLGDMFPKNAFLFWRSNEGKCAETFWYQEDFNVWVEVIVALLSGWFWMSSRRNGR